jgi:hypothetical protein
VGTWPRCRLDTVVESPICIVDCCIVGEQKSNELLEFSPSLLFPYRVKDLSYQSPSALPSLEMKNDTSLVQQSSMAAMEVHGNPGAATTHTNVALDAHVANDPQVSQILQDPPLPSLLDTVCKEMLTGRHPDRPILSRMAIVGEISSKEEVPRNFFDDVINNTVQAVNALDPTNGKSATGEVVGVTGMYIEMTNHFFQLLESEPAHLLAFLVELHQRIQVRKTYEAIRNVQVVFYTDDVVTRSCPKWCVIDGSGMTGAQVEEGRDPPPLEEVIVDVVHGLMQLGGLIMSQGKMQIDSFLSTTAKKEHGKLIPKSDFVERCLNSGLCLTLDEYVSVFSGVPKSQRQSETVQPVEPPLLY